jgi:hypothetical protein
MAASGNMEKPEAALARSARRAQMASDPASGWLTLWLLAVRSWFRRPFIVALAANPGAPTLLLRLLALHRWDVQAAVAANPRCPRRLYRSMVWSPEGAVRMAVGSSPAASPEILGNLIGVVSGSDSPVRLSVAANPSLTQVLADRLLGDRSPYVRAAAAANPAASAAALRRLADGMSEPAWILRAIAGNPSCPADLSDQLLTWIALGGPGHADPMFDPLECTGHPADTRFTAAAWCLEQARHPAAEEHPLWPVRAAVMRATGRISADRARTLSRDPRPEVRRTIAGLARLQLGIRRELRRDADPQVARLASAVFESQKGAAMRRSLAPIGLRILFVLVPAAGVVMTVLQQSVAGQQPATGQAHAGKTTAHGQLGTNLAITSARTLAGGGSIMCGLLSSHSRVAFVSVTAGSEGLTLHMPGAVTFIGRRAVQDPLTVPARGSALFLLSSGHSQVSASVNRAGRISAKTVVTLPRCGR